MTIAYFDCFAGAGGDMIVGALLDAGVALASLQEQLAKLRAEGLSITAQTVQRGGLGGIKFHVQQEEGSPQPHRNLSDILDMIVRASLAPRAAARARDVFTRLAQAEAEVHGIAIAEVHFHEVGAIDSIADIVGACVALELLGVETVHCSPIPVGSGTVQCDHGKLPVPAPATAKLLIGAKTAAGGIAGEATTPTAAALLTTLAKSYGPMPAMSIQAVGYGAGSRTDTPVPNLLRVFVGQPDSAGDGDAVVELSANIDDCTGELLGATIDKLLAAGCLDAWASPLFMKKSRPAWMLSALCQYGDADRAEQIIFAETTTFGIRRIAASRSKLLRRHQTVETPYGPIRVKVGVRGQAEVTASPEFADCQAAAEAHNMPVKEVIAATMAAYRSHKAL